MKRATDLILSILALVFLAPVFLAIAIAIKLDSPGPVFFRSVRIGRNGHPFKPFKFRSLVLDAQKISKVVSTPDDDPRITRVGRVLRRYNLDELPQFINVLRGEMSIVGPRPEVPQYVQMFTPEERVILSVRPGITDWATVWVKDKGKILKGSRDPEADYMQKIRPEKIRLQLKYVRDRSWLGDLKIMLLTLKTHLLDRLLT
jgi:lipopolysaccharide/colanic/teichoic acid biosynthesis glycosyltransferase